MTDKYALLHDDQIFFKWLTFSEATEIIDSLENINFTLLPMGHVKEQ
jgi:hypothetical protein